MIISSGARNNLFSTLAEAIVIKTRIWAVVAYNIAGEMSSIKKNSCNTVSHAKNHLQRNSLQGILQIRSITYILFRRQGLGLEEVGLTDRVKSGLAEPGSA